jgi:hypothetical protein
MDSLGRTRLGSDLQRTQGIMNPPIQKRVLEPLLLLFTRRLVY